MQPEDPAAFKEHLIEWDDQKISRLWDYYSRTPPYCDIYFSRLFGRRILKSSGLPLREPIRVLDFGCGPGFMWEHLTALGARWEYTGIDFSPDSVRKTEQKGQGHPQFAGVHHVTQLPTPLPAERFDAVLLVEVVEHLKDEYLDGTLREVSRVLKRGGMVVVTTPNEEDLSACTKFCPECGAVFNEWQHVRNWSVPSLRHRFQQHGFEGRIVQTLDFTASRPLRRMLQFVRRVLYRRSVSPHMVATFQKR